jgi:ferrous iron transport protein B
MTARIDALAAHPVWGIACLIAILGVILLVTYQVALPVSIWIQHLLVDGLGGLALVLLATAPEVLRVLVIDGLLAGMGTAFSFLPVLFVFFTALALLEESGYLLRASVVMDRYLKRLGLPGSACVPLSMAFGCNTPAVLGCRMLRDRRSQILTTLLIPFVPCTSRLAAIIFLTPIFFGARAPLVTWGLIVINLLVLISMASFVHKVSPRPVVRDFPARLPDYRLPTLKGILVYIWKNISEFMVKVGTLIPILSLIVWALSYFPAGDMQTSYLAGFGRWLLPVGGWVGITDWRFIVALLTSFISKENSIAVLGILFSASSGEGTFLTQIAAVLSPSSALAFLVMQMLFVPCAATVVAIRHESGRKSALLSVGLMLLISLVVGGVIYQFGRFLI